MHAVTIPLRPCKEYEVVESPEDYFKEIQDAYLSKYCGQLGIAPTAANKAALLRERPLDDCTIHGIWDDDGLRGNRSGAVCSVCICARCPPKVRSVSCSEVVFLHYLWM